MMDQTIAIDDSPPPCKRLRSEHRSYRTAPDTSNDLELALQLQAAEEEELALQLQAAEEDNAAVADVVLASPMQAQLGQLVPDCLILEGGITAAVEIVQEVGQLRNPVAASEAYRDAGLELSRQSEPLVRDGRGGPPASLAAAVVGRRRASAVRKAVDRDVASTALKVYVPGAERPIFLRLRSNAPLTSVYSDKDVATELRRLAGLKRAAVATLAKRFELLVPSAAHSGFGYFDAGRAARTSIREAIGESGGVLRLREVGQVRPPRQLKREPLVPTNAQGDCDRVRVLRLRAPDGQFGSPVVLIKNFNCDRGILLAQLTGLKEMVEMAPEARKKINDNVRNELDAHEKTRRNLTSEIRRASDRVLELSAKAISEDAFANAALAHRTEYASTAVLVYERGTTLPRHVDGCGNWVALFSFGVTVDFFAGGKAFKFESGDALIFNGSAPHAVVHGIDRVHKNSTFRGRAMELPTELSFMQGKRASFQSRQGDP